MAGFSRFAKGAVDAAKASGNLSLAAQDTAKQLSELSNIFDGIRENIGKAILESDNFKGALTRLERTAKEIKERGFLGGVLTAIFESPEESKRRKDEKAKWDTDSEGNSISQVIEEQVMTLGKLNKQLKEEHKNLQNINIEDSKAIINQLRKIKVIEDQSKKLTTLESTRPITGIGVGKTPSFEDIMPSYMSKGWNKKVQGIIGAKNMGLRGAPELDERLVDRMNQSLERQKEIVYELTGVFANMFMSVDQGFKGMIESLIRSLQRWVAELAAKAVVAGILNLLIPGSGLAVMARNMLGSALPSSHGGSGSGAGTDITSMAGGGGGSKLVASVRGKQLDLIIRRT